MSTIASHSLLKISETVGDRGLVAISKGPRTIGNGLWGIEWLRYRWRHMTPKGQVVTPIRLESNIAKTAGDAI